MKSLELRQYRSDSNQSKNFPVLKLPRFFSISVGDEKSATFSKQERFLYIVLGFIHLRAASDRSLRATWAKTAATTLLAALLPYATKKKYS